MSVYVRQRPTTKPPRGRPLGQGGRQMNSGMCVDAMIEARLLMEPDVQRLMDLAVEHYCTSTRGQARGHLFRLYPEMRNTWARRFLDGPNVNITPEREMAISTLAERLADPLPVPQIQAFKLTDPAAWGIPTCGASRFDAVFDAVFDWRVEYSFVWGPAGILWISGMAISSVWYALGLPTIWDLIPVELFPR